MAQDRLRLLEDGRIALTLKTAWADGTRQLVFEPLELLEKLAALTPRPRINLVIYHGVLAPHSSWRARAVTYGVPPAAMAGAASTTPETNNGPAMTPAPRHWAWADLMRRAFDIDVLACPRCGRRLRLMATVEDPDAVRAILAAFAESRGMAGRAPPFAAGAHNQPDGGGRRLSGIGTPWSPRSVRWRHGADVCPRQARRSDRKSLARRVVRAVPGENGREGRSAENGCSVNWAFVGPML